MIPLTNMEGVGVPGDTPQLLADEMLVLLKKAQARAAVFQHDIDEVEMVLKYAEHHLEYASGGRGDVLINLREIGYSPSDVAMVRACIPDRLADRNIEIVSTPSYLQQFQIDEPALEEEMERAYLRYRSDAAKRIDVNSIRSVYVLRKGSSPRRVEDCGAIFITNNAALARAAYTYGRRHEESSALSTVITDFSLTNLLWLKSPIEYVDVPRKMIAVNCYAGLHPTDEFWSRLLVQLENLQREGRVSPAQHQYLRYELKVRTDLMNLTFGDTAELSEELVLKVLEAHEQNLTEPLKRQVSELERSVAVRSAEAQSLSGQIQAIEGRLQSIGGIVRRVISVVCVVLAFGLLALAHGWIGENITADLPQWAKMVLRVGVYITDVFLVLHPIFGVHAWNPISHAASAVERYIVAGLRAYFGMNR